MKEENNISLAEYTTFRMGGMAEHFLTPENREELQSVLSELPKPYYCIGGGSNLLINDATVYKYVINLREFDKSITESNGIWKVGASVRLQNLINVINKAGYGGIEYLYSVPGLVGGAVYMNAGRGKEYHKTISDYILSVEVLKDDKILVLDKQDCQFEHRSSIFHNGQYMILSALFKFEQMDRETSSKLKNERIAFCKEKQDNSAYNFGSVFCESNARIMSLFKHTFLGRTWGKGIRYSSKTGNWLLHKDRGTFKDAMRLINRAKKVHHFLKKECKEEVIIWN